MSSVLKMKEAYHKRRDLIVRRFNEMANLPPAERFFLCFPVD